MSLAERLASPPEQSRTTSCRLCVLLREMDPKDARVVEDAVYGDVWTDPAVVREFAKDDIKITKASLANHRQNDHGGRR